MLRIGKLQTGTCCLDNLEERMSKSICGLLLSAVASVATAAPPKPIPLADALIAGRSTLSISPQGFGGDGAPMLRRAIRDASIVAIGEDHGTREIPAFMAAVCREIGPSVGALALEIGETAAEQLDPILRSPDRRQRMADWSRIYPAGVAFLDIEADNDAADDCLAAAPAAQLIGLDQEFLGAAGMVLDEILTTRLTRNARQAVQELRAAERMASGQARLSGDPASLLLLSATPQRMETVAAALAKGGGERARKLFSRLVESATIYRWNATGGTEGNAIRAKLMKTVLHRQMPVTGKVLTRLGAFHVYKGVNPLKERDVGNWIAETMDGVGKPASLHILVVGAKGTQAAFGGYARPIRSEQFDAATSKSARWLAPALAAQASAAAGSTLFDLRKLRHMNLTDVTPEWRRAIDGYDMLLVISNVTASPGIR